MAMRCEVTGKKPRSGHKISHSNRKTKRRFLPNLQKTTVMSDALDRSVTLNVTAAGLRTIDHNGGLDAWLLSTPESKLSDEAVKLKRQVKKALGKTKAKPAA